MRIVLSGGGTAGHVYPALSVADEFLSLGHDVLFVGTPDSFESRLVPQKGITFRPLPASGFNRRKPYTLITSSAQIARSTMKAWSWFGTEKVDAVIGFGGYVSLPVGFAARLRNIPLMLHEQNSVPGMANRQLAKYACAVGVTYPETASYFSHAGYVEYVGNPVREDVHNASGERGREQLDISADAYILLVFGGSRGARHINQAVLSRAHDILSRPNVHVVHITGAAEESAVREELASQGIAHEGQDARWHVFGYVDAIADVLAAADAVVARAGATSIAELTVLGKPMLLVPYPYATEDHQTKNASACLSEGAAFVVSDDALEDETFTTALHTLLDDDAARATMSEASKKLGQSDAAEKLARLVIEHYNTTK